MNSKIQVMLVDDHTILREGIRALLEKQEDMEDIRAIEEVENEPSRPIEEYLAEIGESGLLRKAQ